MRGFFLIFFAATFAATVCAQSELGKGQKKNNGGTNSGGNSGGKQNTGERSNGSGNRNGGGFGERNSGGNNSGGGFGNRNSGGGQNNGGGFGERNSGGNNSGGSQNSGGGFGNRNSGGTQNGGGFGSRNDGNRNTGIRDFGGERSGVEVPQRTSRIGRGESRYQGSNNDRNFGERAAEPNFRGIPRDFGSRDDRQVLRQDGLRRPIISGVRSGYYHYDSNWTDNRFCYPRYVFNPYTTVTIYPSPWYGYYSLPAYISADRCSDIRPTFFSFSWSNISNNYSNDRALDSALRDIRSLFRRADEDIVDDLVPRNGTVAIYFDGDFRYSLETDDFADLLLDGADNVRTTDYRINRIAYEDRFVKVYASQSYRDPWGITRFTYHTFVLEKERRRYVIRAFGTGSPF